MECVRVDVHMGETCWSRCWKLAGTLTAQRGEIVCFNAQGIILTHAKLLITKNTRARFQHTNRQSGFHIVSTGCMQHYPAIIPSIHLETHETIKFLLDAVPRFVPQHCTTVPVIWAMMMGWFKAQTTLILRTPDSSEADFSVRSQLQQQAWDYSTFFSTAQIHRKKIERNFNSDFARSLSQSDFLISGWLFFKVLWIGGNWFLF